MGPNPVYLHNIVMEFEVLSKFLIFYYVDLIWGCSIFKNEDFYQSVRPQLLACPNIILMIRIKIWILYTWLLYWYALTFCQVKDFSSNLPLNFDHCVKTFTTTEDITCTVLSDSYSLNWFFFFFFFLNWFLFIELRQFWMW